MSVRELASQTKPVGDGRISDNRTVIVQASFQDISIKERRKASGDDNSKDSVDIREWHGAGPQSRATSLFRAGSLEHITRIDSGWGVERVHDG